MLFGLPFRLHSVELQFGRHLHVCGNTTLKTNRLSKEIRDTGRDARQQGLILILVCLVFLHLKVFHLELSVDLTVVSSQLVDHNPNLGIFWLVLFVQKNGRDALSVESVQTREDIELSIKNSSIANITALGRVYCDVLVTLITLLVPQLLCVLGVLLDLIPKSCNLILVIFETFTQMFLHVLDTGFFRELF